MLFSPLLDLAAGGAEPLGLVAKLVISLQGRGSSLTAQFSVLSPQVLSAVLTSHRFHNYDRMLDDLTPTGVNDR